MYYLRIKGLIITCFLTLCFSCGGSKSPASDNGNTSNSPLRKAYVVIRSEGGPEKVQRVRNMLATDFSENNVSTEYSLYRAKQEWNQNEIFNIANKGQYDYIILIDQVAKFTIDNQTQIGGKYQIRSYHVQSPNPNWLDLGQSTCNLSVLPSVQKFSREVIRSIVGNQAVFKGHDFEFDDIVMNEDSDLVTTTDSSQDMTSEIGKLRKALEEEKTRTRLAEEERSKLENQLKLEIETHKQKARIAEIEAEDAALKKRERQREIAEAYAAKRETIRKREAEEALNEPVEIESSPKEPTREERISQREETKRRNAELKEAKRKEIAAAALVRKEERQQLVQFDREEKKRLKEELDAKRKENERLTEEDIKRIKAKVAEERRQAEELVKQKKEAERLAKLKPEEEIRQAEVLEELRKRQAKTDEEQVEALAMEHSESKRNAREEEKKRQEALLKAQRLEEKRLAELRLEELQKQEQEGEEQRLADQAKKEEERLAEEKRTEVVLAKQREEERLASEMKKSLDKKKNSEIANSKTIKVSIDKPNAFVIIRGKEEDKKQFEDLEDYIEFDFMFAKAKSKTVIFNKDRSTTLDNILPDLSEENNVIILIDQIEYVGDGASKYQISIINRQIDEDWKKGSSHSYNLNIRADLKQLSKKITEYLSN